MSMAYVELDYEDFVKALRLLHSRTPESSDELKRLLDSYCVKQVKDDTKKAKDFQNVISALQSLNQDVRNETEKRPRASLEDDSEATDIEDNENADGGDFASDLGLACVVCKGMNSQSNNQLFECNECRLMYHQECHKPPITKKDINDPRLVWYCFKCNKNIKKIGGKSVGGATGKLAAAKVGGSALNLSSNSNSPSASPFSMSSMPAKDNSTLRGPQSSFLPADKSSSSQPSFKRAPGKLTGTGAFSGAFSSATKGASSLGSSTRPTSSTAKSNPPAYSSVNAMTTSALDKRFPNLKKAKGLAKYNN